MNKILRAFKQLLLPLFFISLFILFSCVKEESPVNPYSGQKGDVMGTVTTTNNTALHGSKVSIGELVTYTDDKGRFFLRNAPAGERVLVNFTSDNYASTQKVVTVLPDRTTVVDASMLLVGTTQTIGSSGGAVLFSGAKVEFPANSFIDSKGNSFNGAALVKATFFDPANSAFYGCFPGEFKGVRTDNSETQIESYGFIQVEIMNGSEKLNLAAGKTATITLPISTKQSATAPATIPLWYYDETAGKWREQGTASKVGNNYVGSVSHFSNWNCDQPTQTSYLHGRVVDQSGNPIFFASVFSEGIDYTGSSRVNTDEEGYFKLAVKSASNAKVWASIHIFSSATQNIATPPTGETSEIGDFVITIDSTNICIIIGRVIDNGDLPVSNMNVRQLDSTGKSLAYVLTGQDGNFLFYGKLNTKYKFEINYFAYDSSGKISIERTTPSSPETLDLGDIKIDIGGAIVKGRVVDSLSVPLPNINVYSTEGGSNQGREYRTDSLGKFSLWVRPNKSFKIYLSGKNQQSKSIDAESGDLGSTKDLGDIILP
ncbi:MAG: DUF1416 domain-containing protein [Bacteroidetes bacterium]|nr:MAG: DUF1416 domain-containing protein [Bacteroidota bacterium]